MPRRNLRRGVGEYLTVRQSGLTGPLGYYRKNGKKFVILRGEPDILLTQAKNRKPQTAKRNKKAKRKQKDPVSVFFLPFNFFLLFALLFFTPESPLTHGCHSCFNLLFNPSVGFFQAGVQL